MPVNEEKIQTLYRMPRSEFSISIGCIVLCLIQRLRLLAMVMFESRTSSHRSINSKKRNASKAIRDISKALHFDMIKVNFNLTIVLIYCP